MSYYTTNSLVKVRLKMVEMYLEKGKSSHCPSPLNLDNLFLNFILRLFTLSISIIT